MYPPSKRYIYLDERHTFFDIQTSKELSESQALLGIWKENGRIVDRATVIRLIEEWFIQEFTDINRSPESKSGYYNIFDHSAILKPSKTAVLHKGIELLISNLCNGDLNGIEWLHQAILYKYTHLSDAQVPCVVFYWVGWSGKSTFIELLKAIFGNTHVMGNLRQSELVSAFDTINGEKLIYEFAEITAFNNNKDRILLNKMKNLVFAKTIIVRKLYQQAYATNNNGWYFVTSNSMKPVMFDAHDSWNRRFSCFKSIKSLTNTESSLIYSVIGNPRAIQDYLAWLYATYPSIPTQSSFKCLENADKRLVVNNSEDIVDEFITYLKDNYSGKRLTVFELQKVMITFSTSNWIDVYNLKKLFKSNCPFFKHKWTVDGRNVWYYEIC